VDWALVDNFSTKKIFSIMKNTCEAIHLWANSLPVLHFPFDVTAIPLNGLYILFEKGELAHGTNRIVRIGTHTGNDQLRSRLKQHFLIENKDRSIFRKNIGRALLNKEHDQFLCQWELDLTSRRAKLQHAHVDINRQREIEKRVSQYIQSNFSFVVLRIDDKQQRLRLESRLITTVSLCETCRASPGWLGLFSPKDKIRTCGLWLVNELYKQPLSNDDVTELQRLGGES
jgi:hypothetical protein